MKQTIYIQAVIILNRIFPFAATMGSLATFISQVHAHHSIRQIIGHMMLFSSCFAGPLFLFVIIALVLDHRETQLGKVVSWNEMLQMESFRHD